MNTFYSLLSSAGAAAAPLWPKLAAALAIVIVAWVVAHIVRGLVLRAGTRYGLDQRLGSAGLTASVAGVGAALVWLMALPALLGTLELQGLLTPVNALMTRLMSFIPNLMGALGRTPLCYLPQIIGRGDHHIAGLTMRNVDRVGCRIHGLCT